MRIAHYVEWQESDKKYSDCLICNKRWNDIASDINTETVVLARGSATCTREQMSLL